MKFFLVVLLSVSGFLSAQVVSVNMDRVFQEYIRARQAEMQLQQMIQEFREEQTARQGEYQQLVQAFQEIRQRSAAAGLPEEERQRLAEQAGGILTQVREMEQQLRAAEQTRQQQLEAQGLRLREQLVTDIRQRIAEMAETRNWAVVLDASGRSPNGVHQVLFVSPSADVTQEVIQSLNQNPVR